MPNVTNTDLHRIANEQGHAGGVTANQAALQAKLARADQARRTTAQKTSDEIYDLTQILGDTLDCITRARHRLAELASTPDPLPAPALTEDAIVAALKADPVMAGRVMANLGAGLNESERSDIVRTAYNRCTAIGRAGSLGLQSLAVALAAASYRG